jgi:HSP20 family protein
MFHLRPFQKKVPATRRADHPINSLQTEINRLFEDFLPANWEAFGDFPEIDAEHFVGSVTTKVDMSETDKHVLVKVEVPGMTEKEIELNVNKNQLTISGEKKQEKEENEKGWYKMERQYGSFTRTIPLPCEIETDKAEATYKNGVLTVKLPKSTVQQNPTKSISVKPA